MRIQFIKECYAIDSPTVATFDISEDLTEEECSAISDYIYQKIDDWETNYEKDDDYDDSYDDELDYFMICYNACKEIIPDKLIENPVCKTFYI